MSTANPEKTTDEGSIRQCLEKFLSLEMIAGMGADNIRCYDSEFIMYF